MKNGMKWLALAVVYAMVFAGCKKAEAPASGNQDKPSMTFTVGFDAEFPPYGFRGEDGTYKGFDLDLAKEVAKRNGWKIELKAIDWAAKDAELNAGTIDCIWNGFTITEERKPMYTWSRPYVQNKQLVLVKKGSGINKIQDLNGKKVAAQDGSSGAEALEGKQKELKITFKDYKKTKDYVTAKAMLESDAIDAIALDSAVAFGFIEKSPDTFEILAEPLMLEEYGIGFKLGNEALRDQIQNTLLDLVKDGTIAKILQNWRENEAKNGGDGIDFILKP